MKGRVLAALAALGLGCGVAFAAPPEINERIAVDDTFVVTGFCPFDFTIHQVGTVRLKVQGNRSFTNLNLTNTFTGPGGSVTSKDVGLDRVTDNGDGTLTLHATGLFFRADGVQRRGLEITTILASTGEIIDVVVKNPSNTPDSAFCALIG